MKVLHVIPSLGPLRGGPSFVLRTIASGMAAKGIETHVAATDDNGPGRLDVPLGTPIIQDGVVYRYFPRQTGFYLASFPFARWLWSNARNYDLIHIHAVFSFCSNTAALIADRCRIPYVIRPLGVLNRWGMTRRRPILKRASFALVEKRLLSRAAFVHFTSEQERLEASELGFPHRAALIPNPVTVQPSASGALRGRLRARFPALGNRPIVLFLSRIDRKKGLDLLIPAFAYVRLQIPDAALVVAGDGDRRLIEELRLEIDRCNLSPAVIWAGFLEGADKLDAIADADVFVLPSYSENFGVAVVEAMAQGVPVVVTNRVGIHKEVAESGAGRVTSPSVGELASAISDLLSDEPMRKMMSQKALNLAHRFTPQVVIDQIIGCYRQAITP